MEGSPSGRRVQHKSPACHKACQEPAPMGVLSTGPKVCQEPGPARVSHRVADSFRHPPALVGVPPQARSGSLLCPWPPCAAGAPLSHHVFNSGCRGISVLVPGAPPLPPPAQLFLVYVLTPLSAALFWRLLALAPWDTGEASGSFSHKPPL